MHNHLDALGLARSQWILCASFLVLASGSVTVCVELGTCWQSRMLRLVVGWALIKYTAEAHPVHPYSLCLRSSAMANAEEPGRRSSPDLLPLLDLVDDGGAYPSTFWKTICHTQDTHSIASSCDAFHPPYPVIGPLSNCQSKTYSCPLLLPPFSLVLSSRC